MEARAQKRRWKLTAREVRLLIYFAVFAGIVAWKFLPRPWSPTLTIETAHYTIASTATREQTEEIGQVVEGLHGSYSNLLHELPGVRQAHPKLKLRLYKDRAEFRRINPGVGWAEAFYFRGLCHAYFSESEINPYHWMLHEAVHQLNREVAHLDLEKWLDEGLGEYLSTRRIRNHALVPGTIDLNTYPVWWIDELATTGDLGADFKNGSVIPLRAIITDRGGPSVNKEFNHYYLHWWTLTHFLFENERHRPSCMELVRGGGNLAVFEKLFGPVDNVQRDWYAHVRALKADLSGANLRRRIFKQGPTNVATNAPALR